MKINPFIVSHPSCKTPGQESEALQSLVDIGQTVLDAAGLEAEEGMQGINQTETWIDASKSIRKWAMIENRPGRNFYMQKIFIKNKYKLVLYYADSMGELYDLKSDSDQMNNLWSIPDYQEIKNSLMQEMIFAEMDKDGVLRNRLSSS